MILLLVFNMYRDPQNAILLNFTTFHVLGPEGGSVGLEVCIGLDPMSLSFQELLASLH